MQVRAGGSLPARACLHCSHHLPDAAPWVFHSHDLPSAAAASGRSTGSCCWCCCVVARCCRRRRRYATTTSSAPAVRTDWRRTPSPRWLQDADGFVWVGTQGGLHRFDGQRYTLYRQDPRDPGSLPDSFVTALAQDHRPCAVDRHLFAVRRAPGPAQRPHPPLSGARRPADGARPRKFSRCCADRRQGLGRHRARAGAAGSGAWPAQVVAGPAARQRSSDKPQALAARSRRHPLVRDRRRPVPARRQRRAGGPDRAGDRADVAAARSLRPAVGGRRDGTVPAPGPMLQGRRNLLQVWPSARAGRPGDPGAGRSPGWPSLVLGRRRRACGASIPHRREPGAAPEPALPATLPEDMIKALLVDQRRAALGRRTTPWRAVDRSARRAVSVPGRRRSGSGPGPQVHRQQHPRHLPGPRRSFVAGDRQRPPAAPWPQRMASRISARCCRRRR